MLLSTSASDHNEPSPRRDIDPSDHFAALDIDADDKKLKKKNKKKKKDKQQADDMDAMDDVVEFTLPSGEVFELRALSAENPNKYDVKIHMANERTFFKYLFSAFHLGAMGTFLLTYFSRRDEYKLLLVIMTWVTAFSFIFWGLWAYYHRKTLMNDGKIKDTSYLNPHGPAYVFFMFLLIFACILAYAIVTRQYPGKHSPLRMPNGRIMPIPSTLLGDG